jgi:hypothetical protein
VPATGSAVTRASTTTPRDSIEFTFGLHNNRDAQTATAKVFEDVSHKSDSTNYQRALNFAEPKSMIDSHRELRQ